MVNEDMAQSLDHLTALAADARRRRAFDEEYALLKEAQVVARDDPRILNMCGMNSLARSEHEQAVEYFRKAVAHDPTEPTLWLNLATAYRALEDLEGEGKSLEKVIDLDGRNLMGQLRSAELFEKRRMLAQAAQSWSNVLQLAQGIDDAPLHIQGIMHRAQSFLATHRQRIHKAVRTDLDLSSLGPLAYRFQACVDHSLGRRRIYTNQCAGLHYPFLPAEEFFSREHFPWLSALESKTDVIVEELTALLAGQSQLLRPYVSMPAGAPRSKWSDLDGSLDWSACFLWEYGVRNEAVCALCPETAAALDQVPQTTIPGKAPTAFFSLLRPHSHIPAHTGVTNTRTIIHLPLIIPPGCQFRVGGETRPWVKGQVFAFDDTIDHEAWNRSDEPRIVLIFDVWNPYLSVEEQIMLSKFHSLTENLK